MAAFWPGGRLQEQRQLTHENVQRKQARTGEEREEEEEEQLSESESEDEDNEIIYNPKNLPLGWDGKVREHFLLLQQWRPLLTLCSAPAHPLLAL